MKTLCLLRHGQAERRIDLQDFDRPLSAGGVEAAGGIAATLRGAGLLPDLVLCSGAKRARQTWRTVAAQLSDEETDGLTLELREDLYLASEARLLGALRKLPDAATSVLVIGHNPGLHRLARELAGSGSQAEAQARLRRGFPAAGLAALAFDALRWADLAPGRARLTGFFDPA
ncbi:MAG: SixA phosphatase family protein [Alphaproteobacteria bacterium]